MKKVYSAFSSSSTPDFLSICSATLLIFSLSFPVQAQCPPDITVNGAGTDTWTAPSTGGPWIVQIQAIGAGGGNGENATQGGGGATMTGTFNIPNSTIIRAIAGGQGLSSTDFAGGGGGASGAVNCGTGGNCAAGTILILAAGGNGGEDQGDGLGGSTATGGGASGAGGGGNGGGGGGGINASGGDGTGGEPGLGGGQALKTGVTAGGDGAGAVGDPDGGDGMGGGGGGGSSNNSGSGGGAGHTGAAGGNVAAAMSFNSGANQINSDGFPGVGPSDGSVIIICLGSLPVKLADFKAVIEGNKVRLIWSTGTEKDNLGFDVERSADNRHWATLGFVPGNGTSAEWHDYAFSDEAPLTGVNYYRLKQMDTDGKFEYSPVAVADVRAGGTEFDVFPNPSSNGELNLRAVSRTDGEALLEIYDWVGYKVYKETLRLLKGTMVYPFSLATFPKGAYTARLELPDGTVQFRKVILQ